MANSNMSSSAKQALNKLKIECAQDLGMSQYIKENNDHYKGDLPSKVNGAQGGPIGGEMVKRIFNNYYGQK